MHPEFSDASQYLVSIHSAPFLVDPFVFVRDPAVVSNFASEFQMGCRLDCEA